LLPSLPVPALPARAARSCRIWRGRSARPPTNNVQNTCPHASVSTSTHTKLCATHDKHAQPEVPAAARDGVHVTGHKPPLEVKPVVYLPARKAENREAEENVQEVLRAVAAEEAECAREFDIVDEQPERDL
jgi:hypothetical protein